MEVFKREIDALTSTIVINIERKDVEPEVEKLLKDYRRKANIPGFRVGNAPLGMIKRMYGHSIMADELNKKVSHELFSYIQNEKMDILGEPLPSEQDAKTIDWDTDQNFEFSFDVAIAEPFEIKLSKRDKLPYYDVEPGDELIGKYIEGYRKQFGEYKDAEVVSESDLVKVNFADNQSDFQISNASVLVSSIKDVESKNLFIGKKTGDKFELVLRTAFPNAADLKSMLDTDDQGLESLSDNFTVTIESVSSYVMADLNQELFDKVFGQGNVSTEDEFKSKVIEAAKANLKKDADYKLHIDAKEKLISKTEFALPDAFLKRWLITTNQDITQEILDKEYPMFREDMKWQLIKGKVIKDHEIKSNPDDLLRIAKEYTAARFQMYGGYTFPDELIENFASEELKKKEERQKLVERELEEKVIEFVKSTVKLENTAISYDEFNKMFN